MSERILNVLLVEDDGEDALILTDAVKAVGGPLNLTRVSDGLQALAYLRQQSPFENAARPDLIFMDLHLPRVGGIEILRAVKDDPKLRVIPVIALTSSCEPTDIQAVYEAGANCYISKPVGLGEVCKLISLISSFWNFVKLPTVA